MSASRERLSVYLESDVSVVTYGHSIPPGVPAKSSDLDTDDLSWPSWEIGPRYS